MKAVKFGGRKARRFGVRVLVAALACALALAGGAGRFGVSAQKTMGQGASKQGAASPGKVAPLDVTGGRFKGGTKSSVAAASSGGEVTPLALGCANPDQTISFGTTVNGTLQTGDCVNPIDQSLFDAYTFTGTANQQVTINMTSTAFDTYLYLLLPGETTLSDSTIFNDDISNTNTNSRITNFTLPSSGTYTIIANSFAKNMTGNYTLRIDAGSTCTSTPVALTLASGGVTTQGGTLGSPDCTLDDGSFYDVYTFNGTAGQKIAIQMSASFDSFLFLVGPDGDELARDDNGSGSSNARIPAVVSGFDPSPSARLPQTGTYRIIANSSASNVTGSYTLVVGLDSTSCPSTPISIGQSPVNGSLDSTDCRLPADSSFIDTYTFSGTANQTVSVTMTSTALDAYLFILDKDGKVLDEDDNGGGGTNAHLPSGKRSFTGALPATGTYTIYANSSSPGKTGAYTLTLAGTQVCPVVYPSAIPFTQGAGAGRFTVFPSAQCNSWTATTTASWIHITSPSGGAGTGTARVRFTVDANTGTTTRTGTIKVGTNSVTVSQTSASTTPQIQFSASAYSANENDPLKSVQITVQRTGDTTGAASVEYRTVDDQAAVPCDPNSTAQRGTAYARCDYVTTIDTLTFNAGETTKSFSVPVIDDAHVEGSEVFHVALSNPQGATLGAPTDALVTIIDNDTAQSSTNPIHNQSVAAGQTAFFVRMQYLDFLSREPEAGEPWTAIYSNCPNQDNTDPNSPSAQCDRIDVSSAFFGSQEFQVKGFFVFLYYKVSFGSSGNPNYFPAYDEIVPDMRRVTGSTTEERIDKTFNFAEDWVTRPAFVARYGTMTNAQYVDTLLSNVGATLATADPVSGETRNSLVAKLDAGTKTRADVLRNIVESKEVNDLQHNPAFVAMQYYGYLRRTPELGGYQAWLNTINPPVSANPRDMVNGFVNSDEYYLRFGPNVRR